MTLPLPQIPRRRRRQERALWFSTKIYIFLKKEKKSGLSFASSRSSSFLLISTDNVPPLRVLWGSTWHMKMGRIATKPNNVFLKKIKIRKRNQRERERKKGGRREFFEMIYWKKKRRECSSVFFHFISHRVAGCRQIWGCLSKFSSTFFIYFLFHFLLFFICV